MILIVVIKQLRPLTPISDDHDVESNINVREQVLSEIMFLELIIHSI